MIEATIAAAAQLRFALRAAGMTGAPGVRIKPVGALGPHAYELVSEDARQSGDVVNESRGIWFYVDEATAGKVGDLTVDLVGLDFVLRPDSTTVSPSTVTLGS